MTLEINRMHVYDIGDKIQIINGSFAYWGNVVNIIPGEHATDRKSFFVVEWTPYNYSNKMEKFSIYSELLTLL